MRVLVVDRDPVVQQIMRTKLQNMGHQVFEESAKNTAVERLANEEFDVIMLDPAPLTSPRPIVLNIRRNVRNYPYIFMLSDTISAEEALKSGVNDLIAKPVDAEDLTQKLACAEYFSDLVARIGDDSEDFPSAGGVIAKSAFNQLFLSAIDRADRYGEQTYVLFISVNNYQEIKDLDGNYAAEYVCAKLSQYLVRLRRQSDIIGQTAKYEFALLLQRPLYETEPMEAANRFAEALGKYEGFAGSHAAKVEIKVSLLAVPTGRIIVEHIV
jgi:PleD family two-component response regulator